MLDAILTFGAMGIAVILANYYSYCVVFKILCWLL